MAQHKKQNKQNKSNNINLYFIAFVIIIGGLIYYFTSNKSNINNIENNMENNIKSFENSILEDIRIINKPIRTEPFIRRG